MRRSTETLYHSFNLDMGSKGFKAQYKILDKTPIGVCYTLIMTYNQQTEH